MYVNNEVYNLESVYLTKKADIETKRVSDSTAISVSNIAKHAEDSLRKEFNKTGCTL